jgi:hypothetical protein
MLQAGRSRSSPDEVIGFSIDLIPPAALWPWGLTEMSTRKLLGDKGRPVRKAVNLTAICEPYCLENV